MGSAHHAYLSEVFSSIQGEGLLVGLRQIFVRFSGCSLTCDYCDTQESRVQSPEFNIVGAYGNTPLPNPVSPEKLTEIVNSFQTHPNLHHSISLTGGEPLEQVDFLKEWLPMLRKTTPLIPLLSKEGSTKCGVVDSGLSPLIYLETNGILSSHLSEVIDLMDIIGMDIKLPSVAGVKPVWDAHREFLKIASQKEVFVKAVVSKNVSDSDIEQAIGIVSSISPDIPFVIQPKTPIDMDTDNLLRLQEIASSKLTNVRVIPQVHKFMNLR